MKLKLNQTCDKELICKVEDHEKWISTARNKVDDSFSSIKDRSGG
jgi:hypothetical protein